MSFKALKLKATRCGYVIKNHKDMLKQSLAPRAPPTANIPTISDLDAAAQVGQQELAAQINSAMEGEEEARRKEEFRLARQKAAEQARKQAADELEAQEEERSRAKDAAAARIRAMLDEDEPRHA